MDHQTESDPSPLAASSSHLISSTQNNNVTAASATLSSDENKTTTNISRTTPKNARHSSSVCSTSSASSSDSSASSLSRASKKPKNVIGETDVLCGRGNGINNTPGNIAFRKLVDQFRVPYVNARRTDKVQIAQTVIQLVHQSGGRFLELDKGTNRLKEVSMRRATEKACQALREDVKDTKKKKAAAAAAAAAVAAAAVSQQLHQQQHQQKQQQQHHKRQNKESRQVQGVTGAGVPVFQENEVVKPSTSQHYRTNNNNNNYQMVREMIHQERSAEVAASHQRQQEVAMLQNHQHTSMAGKSSSIIAVQNNDNIMNTNSYFMMSMSPDMLRMFGQKHGSTSGGVRSKTSPIYPNDSLDHSRSELGSLKHVTLSPKKPATSMLPQPRLLSTQQQHERAGALADDKHLKNDTVSITSSKKPSTKPCKTSQKTKADSNSKHKKMKTLSITEASAVKIDTVGTSATPDVSQARNATRSSDLSTGATMMAPDCHIKSQVHELSLLDDRQSRQQQRIHLTQAEIQNSFLPPKLPQQQQQSRSQEEQSQIASAMGDNSAPSGKKKQENNTRESPGGQSQASTRETGGDSSKPMDVQNADPHTNMSKFDQSTHQGSTTFYPPWGLARVATRGPSETFPFPQTVANLALLIEQTEESRLTNNKKIPHANDDPSQSSTTASMNHTDASLSSLSPNHRPYHYNLSIYRTSKGTMLSSNETETWIEMIRLVKQFKDSFGHCGIPPGWMGNPQLADWVGLQRQLYREIEQYKYRLASDLEKDRIEQLEKLGFVWDYEEWHWNRCYEVFREYVMKNTPADRNTVSALSSKNARSSVSKSPRELVEMTLKKLSQTDGLPKFLQEWVTDQQAIYCKGDGQLSDSRIAKLEQLGFSWWEQDSSHSEHDYIFI